MRTVYYADDGTEFEEEYECLEYERRLKSGKFESTALLFDYEGKPLRLTDDGFESAIYILCKTNEAAQYVEDQMSPSLYTPWSHCAPQAGCWKWDDEHDGWVSLEDLIKEAHNTIAFLKKILNS